MKPLLLVAAVLAAVVAVILCIGALLPRAHVASRSARYRRSPAALFEIISAFAETPRWRKEVSAVDLLPDQDGQNGKLRFREHLAHKTITYEVDERSPPRRMVTRIADTNLGYSGTWTYELAEDKTLVGGGVRLTITERGEVGNLFFRFVSHFFLSQTASIETYLRSLGDKLGEPTQIE